MQLLLLFFSLVWVCSKGVTAFQSPTKRTCHRRQKISLLYARKHLLYTQQHAHERFLNDTALLNDEEVYLSSSLGDDESSLQDLFHEHVMGILTSSERSSNQHSALTAYEELMGMAKLYHKSKQQPPRRWKNNNRLINLRMTFEIDNDDMISSSSSEVNTLLWKSRSIVQPSIESYEQVAKALVSSAVFHKIGGWAVVRLLEQMLAQVDQVHSASGDLELVKKCINANLIEALSKVGDGPSARRIVHREKKQIDVVQRKHQMGTNKETSTIEKGSSFGDRTDDSDIVAAKENTTAAIVEERTEQITTEGDVVVDQNVHDEEVRKASNALTYAKKIHTYYSNSQHKSKEVAPQSLKLLKQMVKSLEERPHQLEPDMWIFNTVLLIWARSGRVGEVAEEILEMMHRFGQNRSPSEFPYPNDQSYTFAIDAYANSGQKNAGKKALEILQQLQESGWQPNARCISTTIEAIFKAGDPIPLQLLTQMIDLNRRGDNSSVVNSRTFTKAIVRGDADNALRVLDLLDTVKVEGDSSIGPNVVHYNAAIFCLAKSDLTNRTEIANTLLLRMDEEGVVGNVATYTAMLAAQESYDEAERWLWRMEDEYGIAPTTRTYNSCLQALLNSDTDDSTIDRAFSLLSRLEKCYSEGRGRKVDMQPDLVTYTSIANILRKHGCGEVDVERQADWLISRLYQMNCEPDDIFDTAIKNLRLSR